jgi:hypothetical protein
MSVIGRLDKQVEEVLISPLDTDRQRASAKHDAQPDDQPQASEPTGEASGTHQNIRGQHEKEELPVWLL